ncbi:MAG TPA: hypothetical protein VEW90_04050 [Gaiellaceae bacterium]|jgi:hypothetical protein|nr:hypothetical protein [Gaiellaceae bacterium]
MSKKRLLVAALCAVALAALSAGPALAGEVTGGKNPKETPIGAAPENDPHASSICSFSGQNDDPEEPGFGGRVQSWGQDVKNAVHAGAAPPGGVPGQACRGN